MDVLLRSIPICFLKHSNRILLFFKLINGEMLWIYECLLLVFINTSDLLQNVCEGVPGLFSFLVLLIKSILLHCVTLVNWCLSMILQLDSSKEMSIALNFQLLLSLTSNLVAWQLVTWHQERNWLTWLVFFFLTKIVLTAYRNFCHFPTWFSICFFRQPVNWGAKLILTWWLASELGLLLAELLKF